MLAQPDELEEIRQLDNEIRAHEAETISRRLDWATATNEMLSIGELVIRDGKIALPRTEEHPVKAISAAELEQMEIPPQKWIVKDLLPVGLSVLSAPPKYFKSYLALDLCLSVSTGSEFLGHRCEKRDCLYFDLESTARRPKIRIGQILGDDREWPGNLYIITGASDVGLIGEGFENTIRRQLKEHPGIGLIIVDVFQRVRKPASRTQTGYDRDYADLTTLKRIADEAEVCMLLVHHNRKMKDGGDPFNDMSGSTGILGSLDAAWMISKDKRSDAEATLHITGRDMDSVDLKAKFNKQSFRWEYMGTAEDVEAQRLVTEYQNSPIVMTVIKLLKSNGDTWEGSAGELKEASRFFDSRIHEDVSWIGRKVREYSPLFWFHDRIEVNENRQGRQRKFQFSYIPEK